MRCLFHFDTNTRHSPRRSLTPPLRPTGSCPPQVNTDVSVPFTLAGPGMVPQILRMVLPFFRIRYVNGAQCRFKSDGEYNKSRKVIWEWRPRTVC